MLLYYNVEHTAVMILHKRVPYKSDLCIQVHTIITPNIHIIRKAIITYALP